MIFAGVDLESRYLAYATRGRNAWWHYSLTIVAGCALAAAVMIVLILMLAVLAKVPLADLAQQMGHPANPVTFFSGIAIGFGSLVLGLAGAAALIQRKRFGDITGSWHWQLFFTATGIWAAVQLLLVLIDVAIMPHGFSITAGSASLVLAAWALPAILVQVFAEEFIFRGYLTQGLLLLLKKPLPAACVSGLVFGAIHIPNGWPQALNALCFGIVCAWITIRAGGIALTCGIHLANNYFGAAIVVSANDVFKGSPALVTQNTPMLQWWDLVLAVLALAALPWLLSRLKLLPSPSGT